MHLLTGQVCRPTGKLLAYFTEAPKWIKGWARDKKQRRKNEEGLGKKFLSAKACFIYCKQEIKLFVAE